MKTIIKWPGGKSKEIKNIESMIPAYDRYIEPFFGGGAVYFSLEPPKAVVNDISTLLMSFYQLIKEQNADLKTYLSLYHTTFQSLLNSADRNYDKILEYYETDKDVTELVRHVVGQSIIDKRLMPDGDAYTSAIRKMVRDKFLRTRKNHEKKPFSPEDLKENLKTGFTSGYYIYFRDIYNKLASRNLVRDKAYEIANFYFIREYCYGSMFRYNASGEFNIPYGGISYNNKNFDEKINRLFQDDIAALLENTELRTQDFEEFLDNLHLTENDFIFLDPPYDTEFSDYEGRAFTKEDQRRLAETLRRTPARFILIIKNTDFIYRLYERDFRILTFDKSYTYNVRSRNDREVEHLIITNIPE
ncbi:MAG: DNA adenine methylase [Roseburia sp.]|nr:DNA adenine methylase [Roseburia sp.]